MIMEWERKQSFPASNFPRSLLLSQVSIKYHNTLWRCFQRNSIRNLDLSPSVELKSCGFVPHCLSIEKIDNRFILCGCVNGSILLFDLNRHRNVSEERHTTTPQQTVVNETGLISTVQWYPVDNGIFVSSSYTGKIKLYDANCFDAVFEFDFPNTKVHSLRFEDGNCDRQPMLCAGLSDGTVRIFDIVSGDQIISIGGHAMDCTVVDWNPQNKFELLSGGKDGSAKVWDIRHVKQNLPLLQLDWLQEDWKEGKHSEILRTNDFQSLKRQRDQENVRNISKASLCKAHDSSIMSGRYTPCGNRIITAGQDNKLRSWQASSGYLYPTNFCVGNKYKLPFRMEILSFEKSIDDLILFPSNEYDQQGVFQGKISLLPVYTTTGNPIHSVVGHYDTISSIIFRQTTNEVFSCSHDGLILAWDSAKNHKEQRANRLKSAEPLLDEMVTVKNQENLNNSAKYKVFVPPILKRYWEEYSMHSKISGNMVDSETNTIPDFHPPTSSVQQQVEWNSIDSLFTDVHTKLVEDDGTFAAGKVCSSSISTETSRIPAYNKSRKIKRAKTLTVKSNIFEQIRK